jgi:hypothetical protein
MIEINYNHIKELPNEEKLIRELVEKVLLEEKVLSDAKAYSDEIKKSILTGESSEELKDTYDTLVEI